MIEILSDAILLEVNNQYEWNTKFNYNIIDEKKELDRWRAIARKAEQERTRQVIDWGNEVCPHWQGEQPSWKHTCIICWQELVQVAGMSRD